MAALASPLMLSGQDVSETSADLAAEIEQTRKLLEVSDLDDASKGPALDDLQKASEALEAAGDSAAHADRLKEESREAPTQVEGLREKLAKPVVEVSVETPGSIAEFHEELDAARDAMAEKESELAEASQGFDDLKRRPVEVATRLPVANTELSEVEAKLSELRDSNSESLSDAAKRLFLTARMQSLQAEIKMLDQEEIGQSLREKLADLELRIAKREVKAARERVTLLEKLLESRQDREIDQLRNMAQEMVEIAGDEDEALQELAKSLPLLVDALGSVGGNLGKTREELTIAGARLEKLRNENDRLRREVKLGQLDGAFSRILIDQSRRVPDRQSLDFELKLLEKRIGETQSRSFEIEDLQDEQQALEDRWAGNAAAEPVLELRATLLERLALNQRELLHNLARLSAERKVYRDLVIDFSEFVSAQLFWSPSSKPIGLDFFRDLPAGLAWVVAPDRWKDLGSSLARIPERHFLGPAFVGLVLIVLLSARRRLRATIEHSGREIGRVSSDRMMHTMRGLLATVLLAIPVPLVLWFLRRSLDSEPSAETWVRGFSSWLQWASWSLMWVFFLRELAAPGGVGRVHFGWNEENSKLLRKTLALLPFIYLPALLIASVTMQVDDARHFDSVGRLGIIFAELGIAGLAVTMFRPSNGVLSCVVREHPDWFFSRISGLWIGIFLGIPLVLVWMALAGYVLTAIMLSEQFLVSLRWVAGGFIAYGVLLRFFLIKQRKIALNEAIREQKAKHDSPDKEDDIELDLEAGARQTRRLVRSLVGLGVIVGICYAVSGALPVDEAATELSIDGRLTALGVIKAFLIALITFITVKNLPGMLDIGGMREHGILPGTRYAVATLSQYAVAAFGIYFVAQALHLDWARLGWIAAALSVGLGFGLQEVVANFVCGIIILFERPVRVGDVVTVGQVTGTISRIRMRATTITNWDRQEFVVPNKDFITGSLINWTLSNPINRLTIEVGVAYGSDTVRARGILAEIAAAHPVVLADPPPLITFDRFADSTLNLSMRVYLPNMDNRLKTRSEIYEEIDRRFKEVGIEIAFPQRVLHLQTVPNEMIRGGPEPQEQVEAP